MNTHRLSGTLVAWALAGSVLAACGGEVEAAVCDDVDDLRASLTSLQAFDVSDPNVLADLSVVLEQVRSQARTLAEDASSEYDGEVDGVQTSIDGLEASAQAAVATPSAVALTTLAADVRSVGAAFEDLATAVGDTC